MRVFALGCTGFLGPYLLQAFLAEGAEVLALVRNPSRAQRLPAGVKIIPGDPLQSGPWQEVCASSQVVLNLTGASIFTRWTRAKRKLILKTRVLATHQVVEALAQGQGPRVLLNASAVGYYGAHRGEEELTETSPPGRDFLAEVCKSWEKEAFSAEDYGIRVCVLRLGVVLGQGGGALARALPLFRLGLGGPFGSGRQWFPWIHVTDVAQSTVFLARDPKAQGPFNLVAPGLVRQAQWAKALGDLCGRPARLRVPEFVLKLFLGEAAGLLVGSLKVRPKRLEALGYRFSFPSLGPALRDLLSAQA